LLSERSGDRELIGHDSRKRKETKKERAKKEEPAEAAS
jgi:hypothetical protein